MQKSAAILTNDSIGGGLFWVVFLLGGILLVVILRIFVGLLQKSLQAPAPSPGSSFYGSHYFLKGPLVSPAEKSFLEALESLLPPEIRVLTKIRVADILAVRASNRSVWQSSFNRISGKHVDFLLCRADDFSPLVAIELDDKSHQHAARRRRDEFLNLIFAEAGLPLLRVKARRDYPSAEMAALLEGLIPSMDLMAVPDHRKSPSRRMSVCSGGL